MKRTTLLTVAILFMAPATASLSQESASARTRGGLEELSRRFDAARTEADKKALAAAALRSAREEGVLLDREPQMRDLLIGSAAKALAADVPYPLAFDTAGYSIEGQPGSEFVAWANAHGIAVGEAARRALYDDPIDMARLVGSTDPMVLATFEDALEATNHLVVLMAIEGLAAAGETDSIPQIEELGMSSPAEVALALADALDSFGTPEGQSAAEEIRALHHGG